MNKQVEATKKKGILADKENLEYEKYSEEVRSIITKGAVIYIPELAEKLIRKYRPESELTYEEIRKRNRQIEDRLVQDWGNGNPWATQYIYHCLPRWVKNPRQINNTKNINFERKVQKTRTELSKVFSTVQLPRMPKPVAEEIGGGSPVKWKEEEELDEPLLTQYGDKGKDVLDLFKEISEPARELWTGLTGHEHLPGLRDDLLGDHIKPTRDFRKHIASELPDDMRVTLRNTLAITSHAISDMIDQLDKAKELERKR